jgi:hypothetical protein
MGPVADIAAALAVIPDQELHVLRAQLTSGTVIVPGLLRWLKAAIDWETSRRAGTCGDLPGPRTAVGGRGDVECSLVVLALLQAQLPDVIGAAKFLDVTANALCVFDASGSGRGVH